MFFGEYSYKIDEKGRVPVPPKFRNELRDGVVLTHGIEPCITVYTIPEWKKLASSLTTGSLNRNKQRRLNRAIFATAFTLRVDAQGRITLPLPMREYAGIEEEVIIAGTNTYFEMWDKDQWEEEKANSQEEAWQIIESLENQ